MRMQTVNIQKLLHFEEESYKKGLKYKYYDSEVQGIKKDNLGKINSLIGLKHVQYTQTMSTQKLLHSEEEFDKIGRAPQLSPTKDHLLNGLKMRPI